METEKVKLEESNVSLEQEKIKLEQEKVKLEQIKQQLELNAAKYITDNQAKEKGKSDEKK